jgi:hypothetical protein
MLAALADLAGYTVDVRLDGHLKPDVSRLHQSSPRLLVADAKATESPHDRATRARLTGYAERCASWRRAGFEVSLAVCHGEDHAGAWQACLRSVSSIARLGPCTATRRSIDGTTWVSTTTFPPAASSDLRAMARALLDAGIAPPYRPGGPTRQDGC